MKNEGLKILDLGIGGGGNYIRSDHPTTFRIGADIRGHNLNQVKRRFGIEVCRMDAQKPQGLPFGSDKFDAADIIFPHGKLLYSLTSPHLQLWSELHRIVKKDGHVRVVFDVPPEGYRVAETDGFSTRIYQPETVLWKIAADNDFSVELEKVGRDYLRTLGTQFSNRIANRLRNEPGYAAYELIARKRSAISTSL